ncbi:MAG: hypothetical protein IKG14_02795 [Clostridia bacterium]|nr:hypothetical protein [Clostridia bacterium]
MKVLFAVSNDTVTTSIVNKYQQTYKEIVTSKNVYYFNAIVKELQRDKNYDCIIIEEDLEPISNNNYEAIDNFLFEKLDSISDEASKPTGEDIPIVFVCSDRRTKSDDLLRKLFSMSIYNALVGDDRSLDKVCELMSKPRNKKEAKKYYQIEGNQVDYEAHKDEIVSEEQIQNILNYYKKIGSNERKCVQAFDSISKQYDNTQLRIIVKFLPMNVKAILESNSATYQRLMSNGTVLSNGQYSPYTPSNPKKPEKLDFIAKNVEDNKKLDKPVVIPSNMNYQQIGGNDNGNSASGYGQSNDQQQANNMRNQQYMRNASQAQYNNYNNPYGTMRNQYGNNYRPQNNSPYSMGQQMYNSRQPTNPYYNNMNVNPYHQNMNYNNSQNNTQQNFNNMGQPYVNNNQLNVNNSNNATADKTTNSLISQEKNGSLLDVKPIEPMKPLGEDSSLANNINNENKVSENKEVSQEQPESTKKRRGRPRKIKASKGDENVETAVVEPIKKRRGRPRKIKNFEEHTEGIQNNLFDENNNKEIGEENPAVLEEINSNDNMIVSESNKGADVLNSRNNTDNLINNSSNMNNKQITQNSNYEIQPNKKIHQTNANENKTVNLYDLDINGTDPFDNIYNNEASNVFGSNAPVMGNTPVIGNSTINNQPINNIPTNNEPIDNTSINNETIGTTLIDNATIQQPSLLENNDNSLKDSTMLIEKDKTSEDIEALKNTTIAGNGKIVAFVGTSKNGTSFIINNLAQMLSQDGINVAILDVTKNKNSYYMYTDNDANKVKVATDSLKNLSNGIVKGLSVKNNLTVFTSLPDQIDNDNLDNKTIIEKLAQQFDVILVDCDFKTDLTYFILANEIYLVQSMDALTIQPLTKFLSDLKLKNILDESKLKVIINKYIKLKRLDDRMIVGGMSKYNEPSMTLQRDLFNPKKITTAIIPFDDQTYFKYLESIALCQFSLNGFSREVIDSLEKLKSMVYPLIAGNSVNGSGPSNYVDYNVNGYSNQTNSQHFSSNVNDTLNKMRTNNF